MFCQNICSLMYSNVAEKKETLWGKESPFPTPIAVHCQSAGSYTFFLCLYDREIQNSVFGNTGCHEKQKVAL